MAQPLGQKASGVSGLHPLSHPPIKASPYGSSIQMSHRSFLLLTSAICPPLAAFISVLVQATTMSRLEGSDPLNGFCTAISAYLKSTLHVTFFSLNMGWVMPFTCFDSFNGFPLQ